MYNNNPTIKRTTYSAPREIKDSAHYEYVTRGITLDGGKFTAGELLLEGTCLVMDNASGLYEKYADAEGGTFPAGKSHPCILDESIKLPVDGVLKANFDVTAGQVLVHGSVIEGMLIGCTAAFKTALAGAVRFN